MNARRDEKESEVNWRAAQFSRLHFRYLIFSPRQNDLYFLSQNRFHHTRKQRPLLCARHTCQSSGKIDCSRNWFLLETITNLSNIAALESDWNVVPFPLAINASCLPLGQYKEDKNNKNFLARYNSFNGIEIFQQQITVRINVGLPSEREGKFQLLKCHRKSFCDENDLGVLCKSFFLPNSNWIHLNKRSSKFIFRPQTSMKNFLLFLVAPRAKNFTMNKRQSAICIKQIDCLNRS